MPKEKEYNLQYRRTDQAIINAFYDLLDVKPFAKITVQNILDMALVSRSTFYQHYRNKFDIAEHLFSNFKKTFNYFLNTNFVENARNFAMDNQPDLIDKLGMQNYAKYFLENKRLLGALFKIHTDDIDLDSFLYNYFREKYRIFPGHRDRLLQEEKNILLETEIYANIQSALSKYIYQDMKVIDTLSLETQDLLYTSLLRAAIFSIGIRSEEHIQAAIKSVKAIKEDANLHDGNYQS